MNDCIFCKIIEGKIPCAKVYDDDKTVAFLDIMPANKGHCLVVPKKHFTNLIDMDEKSVLATMNAAKKIAKALSLSVGSESFNLLMNNGKEAGQIVNHAHVHVIPRFAKDRLRLKWSHLKYEDKEINEFAGKIRKFI